MWIAWGVFGFIQVSSNRYLKKYWRVNIWIHRISGTFILLITIAMGIVGIYLAGWQLTGETHDVIGLIVFFSTLFVALGGIFARSRARRLEWKTKVIHRV